MGTRATVFIEYGDNVVLQLPQVLYDGYPQSLGKAINSLQDVSAVTAYVINDEFQHIKKNERRGAVVFYQNINDVLYNWRDHTDSDYVYVYTNDKWFVSKVRKEGSFKYYLLTSLLNGEFSEEVDDWLDPVLRKKEEKPVAPTVTYESIKKKIRHVDYWESPSGKATVCELTLENGFTVRGESAVVCIENFKKDVGRKIAYDNAVEKIWMLEGYLLQEKLYQASNNIKEDD